MQVHQEAGTISDSHNFYQQASSVCFELPRQETKPKHTRRCKTAILKPNIVKALCAVATHFSWNALKQSVSEGEHSDIQTTEHYKHVLEPKD